MGDLEDKAQKAVYELIAALNRTVSPVINALNRELLDRPGFTESKDTLTDIGRGGRTMTVPSQAESRADAESLALAV